MTSGCKMKVIQKFGLLISGAVLVFGVMSPVVTQAAGSGAGTQSTEITLDALEAVEDADTISEVKSAVQSFLDQYDLAFSTDSFSMESIVAVSLTESDFEDLRALGYELIKEWSKYTTTWVAVTNLETIYASKDLKVGPPSPSQKRCASFGLTAKFLVYDSACRGASIHHEYAHYLIHTRFGSYTFDAATWNSYNPAGFNYGTGGAATYGTGFVNTEHPQAGFVTNYARTGMEEDQADVYAYLFGNAEYTKLVSWLSGDTNLTQKVNRMKTMIASVDASMNNAYFQAVYDYAKDVPALEAAFSGPGTKYIDPHTGDTIWIIPSEVTSSPGTSVGGIAGRKETLILDGKIAGGWFSGIMVEAGGTLKGTGLVEVFIDVKPGGILAPGHSPGCMNSGDLIIAGTYQAEIGGNAVCTGYDQMKVTGTVDLTGGTLEASLFDNYEPKAGESYVIIDNDSNDAVTGTFTNLPEGATFTLGGAVLKISYVGGDGNDVVLSVVTAPAAPDTGAGLIMSRSLLPAFVMFAVAGGLLYLSRRYSTISTRQK